MQLRHLSLMLHVSPCALDTARPGCQQCRPRAILASARSTHHIAAAALLGGSFFAALCLPGGTRARNGRRGQQHASGVIEHGFLVHASRSSMRGVPEPPYHTSRGVVCATGASDVTPQLCAQAERRPRVRPPHPTKATAIDSDHSYPNSSSGVRKPMPTLCAKPLSVSAKSAVRPAASPTKKDLAWSVQGKVHTTAEAVATVRCHMVVTLSGNSRRQQGAPTWRHTAVEARHEEVPHASLGLAVVVIHCAGEYLHRHAQLHNQAKRVAVSVALAFSAWNRQASSR